MAQGAIAVTDAAAVILAANKDRGQVVLQHVSGSPIYLSFDTDVPVVGEGPILSAKYPVAVFNGYRAIQAINGICDTALTAVGAYVTDPQAAIQAGADLGDVGDAAAVAGSLHAQQRYIAENVDQIHIDIDDMDTVASWVAGNDASGITQEAPHIAHHSTVTSLSLDKSGATEVDGFYGKTITAVDASVLSGDALVTWFVKRSSWPSDLALVAVRLGTDSSNYNQYGIDPTDFSTTLWNHITMPLHEGVQTGTGLNLAAITYVAFGVVMDAVNDTITEVFFNELDLHSINVAELQSGDVTANTVRVVKVGSSAGSTWPKDAGNSTNGTPRIVTADDSPEVALLGKMYPADSTANANSAAGNGSWVAVTLAANTIYADVTVAGTCHISASNSAPSGAIGAKVFANILVRLATPNGKLWAFGVSAAHVINTTSYTRA